MAQSLIVDWLDHGTALCLLQGFSGVGKSTLAEEVIQTTRNPVALVRVSSETLQLADIQLEIAVQLDSEGHGTAADLLVLPLDQFFVGVLREPCVVVVDNFEGFIHDGALESTWRNALVRAAETPNLPGRMLIISSQELDDRDWPMNAKRVHYPTPETPDAIRMFERLLEDNDCSDAVPPAQREDVVNWLGRNPRALGALVACLRDDSLDQLIDLEPDAWALRETPTSPELISRLEQRFLGRLLDRLSPATKELAQALSVYRRPFVDDALKRYKPADSDRAAAIRNIRSHFILTRTGRWNELNRVARELLRASPEARPGLRQAAMKAAAVHYSRHFDNRNAYARMQHGTEFVEARYFLMNTGQEEAFQALAGSFRMQLRQVLQVSDLNPTTVSETLELTAQMAAALDGESAAHSKLRFSYAKLLVLRNYEGDKSRALNQLEIATAEPSSIRAWYLRLDLTAELRGPQMLPAVARQSIANVAGLNGDVYLHASRLLYKVGAVKEALALLDEAISSPRTESTGQYNLAAGILARLNRMDEAIDLLLVVPRRRQFLSNDDIQLVERAMLLAYGSQRIDRIRQIMSEVSGSTLMNNQHLIGRMLIAQSEDAYDESLRLAYTAPQMVLPVASQASFSAIVLGQPREAKRLLAGRKDNLAIVWQRALIAMLLDDSAEARTLLSQLDSDPGADADLVGELFRLWERRSDGDVELYPAFVMPKLPATLTGLGRTVFHDIQTADSLSPEDLASIRLPLLASTPGGQTGDVAHPGVYIAIQQSFDQGDKVNNYTNNGQAGAFGENASARDFQQVFSADGAALAEELELLSASLDPQEAIVTKQAADDIRNGQHGVAQKRLASLGKGALEVAKNLGTAVAARAIASALGMP